MQDSLLHETLSLYKQAWRAAGSDSDIGLAGTCLRENPSFRLLGSAAQDKWVGMRAVKRIDYRWKNRSDWNPVIDPKFKTLVLDGRSHNAEHAIPYVEAMLQQSVGHFISRDDLPGELPFAEGSVPSNYEHWRNLKALECVFKSDRVHRALGIYTVLELALILEYVELHAIDHVVDFAPYLIDSNLLYLLLQRRGVRVTKVPSSGPLATHNHILLADCVALSTPYQVHEMKALSKTFRANKVASWIPERALEYLGKYAKSDAPKTQTNTLGFYSHGGWVRADQQHTSDGLHIHEQEEELLSLLGAFVAKRADWTLVVFPHPREKKPEMQERTRAHYAKFLPLERIDLRLDEVPTSQQFEAADIGVAVFSTIVYERLFCGYKTRIFNTANPQFPAKGTDLNNMCARNAAELEAAIDQAAQRSAHEDFEACGLAGYRWEAYPQIGVKG